MNLDFDFKKLKYSIIGGKASYIDLERSLRKNAWATWEPFWREIYESVGSTYKPSPDDFLRQDIVHVLEYEQKVVGLLCSSMYDLKCDISRLHSYMKFYNTDFFKYMIDREKNQIMTFEYLTLLPDFRKSKIGLALAPIMFRGGLELFKRSRAEAMIVTARNDVKVNEILYKLGFHSVQSKTQQRNFECDLIALFPEEIGELVGKEQEVFDYLWSSRYQSELLRLTLDPGEGQSQKDAA